MMDPEKFKHDVSRYERPTQRFRCGRAADWGKPCEFGPATGGRCGGTTECRPAKVGDRFECRRSPLFGGPCDNGPQPDGGCSQQHPPCRPRRTLRSIRGFLSLSAFTAVVAVIAVFLTFDGGGSASDSIKSAGGLTGGHANFTSDTGCGSCHAPHDEDPGDWFLAAFHEEDMTGKCLDCHTFGGDARLAHNRESDAEQNAAATQCVMCHTEHKGEAHDIANLSDSQCNLCHEKQTDDFGENHPSFGDLFPHDRRSSIAFDHNSHITTHFVDARYADSAPEDCTTCHEVDTAAQAVEPTGFDSCASCHYDSVVSRDLVLLRLPELEDNLIDQEQILETCGPTLDEWSDMMDEMSTMKDTMSELMESMATGEVMDLDNDDAIEEDEEDEEFEAVSVDEPTPVSAYLLGITPDDMGEYGEPIQELIGRLVDEGPAPIAEAIDERAGDGAAGRLLAGLNAELVKRVACAWAANLEYEAPMDPDFGGWYGEGVELKYRPLDHADSVARAWLGFATQSVHEETEELVSYAEMMRDTVLSRKEGVGACTKCHAVTDQGDGELVVEWNYQASGARPYTRYSHGTHLTLLDPEGVNLMDPERGCRVCHKMNSEAQFAESFDQSDAHHFNSNFFPISQDSCAQCHNRGQVRQDCQLCHVYHYEPGFDLRMASDDEDGTND
jgi:hypothetical protein